MPGAIYNQVISEAKTLNLSDQLRLLEQMAAIIRQKTTRGHTRSILELKGMGKEIWKEVDVGNYLEKERSSWNG